MNTTLTNHVSTTTKVRALSAAMPLLVALLAMSACSRQAAPVADTTSASSSSTGTITFVFKTPDGELRREIESVSSGSTIADVMAKIDDPKIDMIGSGDTAFVKSIGDLGTTDGKGWSFSVDGKWADRGIGAYELTPPATIEWTHGAFDPSEQ